MALFEAIKQSRDMERVDILQRAVGTQSWSHWLSVGQPVGSERITQHNITKKFRPGRLSLNPIYSRERFAGCSTATGSISVGGKPWVEFSGPLAAYIADSYAQPLQSLTWQQAKVDLASMQCYRKMAEPEAGVGMMLAELKETVSMLRSPFSKLPKLLRKLQQPGHSGGKSGGSAFTYASNAWLTERFGIAPVLNDIEDIRCLTTAKLFKHLSLRKKSAGTNGSDTISSINGVTQIGNLWVKFSMNRKTYEYWRASSYYTVVDSTLDTLNALGLNPLSLPSIAWELVPLSFVVDRFINIGGWLEAMRPMPEYKQLGGCTSCNKSMVTTVTTSMAASNSYGSQGWSPAYSSFIETQRVHYRLVGLHLPDFPPVNPRPLSLIQEMDHLSLLWQRMPRIG
jgi:hypothetical protein